VDGNALHARDPADFGSRVQGNTVRPFDRPQRSPGGADRRGRVFLKKVRSMEAVPKEGIRHRREADGYPCGGSSNRVKDRARHR